nr:MAG TPA: pNOB8 ParB like protein [Caudoviricetes sp.]
MMYETPFGKVECRTATIQEWYITPDLARKILKGNVNNRTLNKARVHSYASDMKASNWEEENPQNSIVISDDGELKDGQHRLTALIQANVCLWFKVYVVVTNYQFDRGRPRSFADTARLQGKGERYTDNKAIGAAKLIAVLKEGEGIGNLKIVSDKRVEDVFSKNEMEWENVRNAVNYGFTRSCPTPSVRRSACIAALYCAAIAGVPYDTIKRFCEVANTQLPANENEYAAAIFGRNIIRGHNGSNTNLKEFNAAQEALADFVDGKKRIKAYPGIKSPFFDFCMANHKL